MKTIDPREFRNALGQFATGVTVITTRDTDGHYVGVTASSFNTVSLDPPLVLWSIDKSSASLDAFSKHGYFAVHVLAAGQEHLSNNFARRGEDKFANIECTLGQGEVPLLPECAACFQCKLAYEYDGGDHVILVGEVLEYQAFDAKPLIFHGGRYARAKECLDQVKDIKSVLDFSSGAFSSDFMGYLVSRAHYQLHLPLLHELKKIGLKEVHYFVLSVLCVKKQMALSDVIEFLAHTGCVPDMDDCLEMEQLGLLNIIDKATGEIAVTEKGKSIYVKLLSADMIKQEQALADFTPEELTEFIGYMRRIIDKTDPGVPDLWA